MRDNKKDRPHQPRVLPQNLENGGFQQSYPSAGSYNHQPQQPTNTNSVPGYQYSYPSNIANSLEESSAVEGYPPNQNRYTDSYDHPHPPLHQSAASSLPPRSGISHQRNSLPPQPAAPAPLTPRARSSHQHNSSPPQSAAPLPTRYNEQQPPVSATYQPSAPSTDQDDEDEYAPVAYPAQYSQHVHAPVALMPVDSHVTTAPTAHPIHTSPINDHEHVQPAQNIYGDPHTRPSQKPMVQPQPSLPPSTQPLIRQSVVSSDPQVPPVKPLRQPSINFSSLSDVTKPPDGYPTVGQHQPSTEPQSSGCCCTIL